MNTDMKNVYISPQMGVIELDLKYRISIVIGSMTSVPVHGSSGDMDASTAYALERMMEEEEGYEVEDLW